MDSLTYEKAHLGQCSAGTYSTTAGASSCTNCGTGTYSTTAGASLSSSCTNCVAGTYSNTEGVSSCTDCVAGSYSDTAGASSCSPHRAVVRAPLEHGRKALSPGWWLGAERSERVRGRPCGKWLRDDRSGPRCGASFDARLAAAGGWRRLRANALASGRAREKKGVRRTSRGERILEGFERTREHF